MSKDLNVVRKRALRYPSGHSKCVGLSEHPRKPEGATEAGDGKSSGDRKQPLRFEESPGHRRNTARESLRLILTPFLSRAMGMTENLRTKNIHVAILTGYY